jgi:hypothetical protein
LEQEVNEYIKLGYKPVGNMRVNTDPSFFGTNDIEIKAPELPSTADEKSANLLKSN